MQIVRREAALLLDLRDVEYFHFTAAVSEIGVKDVILPDDVRDLLNKVVEAERVARANNIRW